jgi:hypothetical protein
MSRTLYISYNGQSLAFPLPSDDDRSDDQIVDEALQDVAIDVITDTEEN